MATPIQRDSPPQGADSDDLAAWRRFRAGEGYDAAQIFGAHPLAGGGYRFTVWAPGARDAFVEGDFSAWRGLPMRPLVASPPPPQPTPTAKRRRGGGQGASARAVTATPVAPPLDPAPAHAAAAGDDPRRGAFTLDVPTASAGQLYKFAILGADGEWRRKADPYAFASELRPGDASRLAAPPAYAFTDDAWLARRATTDWRRAPIAIYELHLGSWRRHADGRWLSYRELAAPLIAHVQRLGFTHVELLPPMEHPYDPSWGYQVTGYFAATARFGDADDLRALVDAMHAAGIGVLADWVPAHFPRDLFGLQNFDGTPLYEYADARLGAHPDWGTLVFDYGRPEVRSFLLASALHWLTSFHLDGLRVDAVASMLYRDYSRPAGAWIPNALGGNWNLEAIAFLQTLNATVRARVPGALMCAEESTSFPRVTAQAARGDDPARGGLGFTFKWSMGWMHDTLGYLRRGAEHRAWHHNELTFPSTWFDAEHFILPLSHDEVVHGKGTLARKMAGRWQDGAAQQRALLGWQWCFPGKKLLFMGAELVVDREWDVDRELPWAEADRATADGMAAWLRALNDAYRALPALHAGDGEAAGLRWLDADDAARSVYSFLRCVPGVDPAQAGPAEVVAVIASFSDLRHEGVPLRLPRAGRWALLACSDEVRFAGRTPPARLARVIDATDVGGHIVAHVDLPPFGVMLFAPPPLAGTDAAREVSGTSAAASPAAFGEVSGTSAAASPSAFGEASGTSAETSLAAPGGRAERR